MRKKTLILGIETSCDETAAAIIEENNTSKPDILSNVVSSQIDVHKEFGGVVPELAARSHIEKIDLIVKKAIKDSCKNLSDIDAIAVTAGPGLIVCLSVGLNFAKSLALSLKEAFYSCKPFGRSCFKSKISNRFKISILASSNIWRTYSIFKC